MPEKVNSMGEDDLDPRKTDNSPREEHGEKYLTPEELDKIIAEAK